jgi:hypothetical protein
MSTFSHCVRCGQRLRDAFFCPHCHRPLCDWRCLTQHLERHADADSKSQEHRADRLSQRTGVSSY